MIMAVFGRSSPLPAVPGLPLLAALLPLLSCGDPSLLDLRVVTPPGPDPPRSLR